MDDLVRFTQRDDLGVLVQIAIAHAQFETIHPFEDGNGRTGRALVHAILDWGVLTGALDATTPALLRAIDRLVGAEVLVEATGAARNRAWIAPDVLDALDRFAARAGRRVRG